MRSSDTLKIVASETVNVDENLGIGTRQVKTVDAFEQTVPVSSLMVRRGGLTIELTLSNVEQNAAETDKLARTLFATALSENSAA